MLKQSVAGIDVSAQKLDVAAEFDGGSMCMDSFANDSSGHGKLCQWLTKGQRAAKVVVESTGIYSLDAALALHRAPGVTVMVANPRSLKGFARASMLRSKTDSVDAGSTLEYAKRMPFVPWEPPSSTVLEIRAISRRMAALTVERTREKNRLHSMQATKTSSKFVVNDIEVNIRHLDRRIEGLATEAQREKGKKPLQALVAVMRKLLHAIFGMLRANQSSDGEKFYRMA